jgi:hypothetical protein
MAKETFTSKQLLDISKKLKEKYPHWLQLLADGISKEKDWKMYSDKDCTRENARHISMGTTKSQFHRRLFMKIAVQLNIASDEQVKEINELLNQEA